MIYVLFGIRCWIFKKNLKFSLFKTVIFGDFLFGTKNNPKLKKIKKKNGQNHQIALSSFTFHFKNPLFDVDHFSRTFDMEMPYWELFTK